MNDTVWFLILSLASVLVCHTLAKRLERRGRSEQRRKRQADIRRRKLDRSQLPVDYIVIQELRRP